MDRGRALFDFFVIGAQKAGTTSLWHYLRPHPQICIPSSKELPIFSANENVFARLDELAHDLWLDAPVDSLRGTVTPSYMIGTSDASLEAVAERIALTVPKVKLIALLRDPIERAISAYMMAVRRRQEARSIEAALAESLEPDELKSARLRPAPTNTYVTAGEYARILGSYSALFPAEQLLTVFTEDLEDDAGVVLDAVLAFLGMPTGFRPDGLDVRHFRSGTRKLLDPESEMLLRRFHKEQVMPLMRGSPLLNRMMFDFFYETWNVAAETDRPSVSAELRTKLEEHFRVDAEDLAKLSLRAPWVARWDSVGSPEQTGGR